MKKYSSYFLLTHQSHLLLLLCVYPFSILAKPQYVFQSENPIANFAWEENDTSRNEQAYFCFNDSTEYINFGEFLNRNIIMPDNGADAQALCFIEIDVIHDGEIENIKVMSNCEFCNAAVEKAVKMSAQYWKIKLLTHNLEIEVCVDGQMKWELL